jgi:dienelactone hydrolase
MACTGRIAVALANPEHETMTTPRELAVNAHAVILGCLSLVAGPGLTGDAGSQPHWHNLEAGENAVGFRLLQERDETRVVAGPTAQARPVRVYLWYPTKAASSARPMLFGRYAALAEDDVWPVEVAASLREKLRFSRYALARSLGPDGFQALGEQPVRAFEDAVPLPGPFPLIVVGQGLYYESPVAFAALSEYLAGRGFVVATCPLSGTHTPIVKLDVEDLETQVRDLEFVVARARAFPFVSSDKLGVMGFDMGGMAGLIFAMRNADVDAFASVPSGILYPHPSGLPAASPDYDPLKLRIPWLHAAPRQARPNRTTTSLFDTAVHSERYHVQIEDLNHVDSTSYAMVEGRDAVSGLWPAWEAAGMERHRTLSLYVSRFFEAFLLKSPESLAVLSRDPQQATAAPGVAIEHRSATHPPITYAQFVNAVLTGDAARAMDEVRQLRDTHPDHILLSDFYLYRLAYSLLYSWGLGEESMQLAELNVELNPASSLATRILGMNYVDRGNYDAAIEIYRKLLELRPADEDVKSTLGWLQSQKELRRNRN